MSTDRPFSDLIQDITQSHDNRQAAIAELSKQTYETLERFRRERQELTRQVERSLASVRHDQEQLALDLRRNLTSAEQERQQDFASMMKDIKADITALVDETHQMLAAFADEQRELHDSWQQLAQHMAALRK